MRVAMAVEQRRDRVVGVALSLAFHLAALFLSGRILMQPARYGMELGSGGLEVSLVAAPPRGAATAHVEVKAPELSLAKLTADEVLLSEPLPSTGLEKAGQDPTTFYSAGGGQTDAKPGYLKNPAPPYPEAARRLGQEGVVILLTAIDKKGNPTRVEVRRSSGYPMLDKSALETVCCWKFTPARMAGMPVDSMANLQVRFVLNDRG